MELRGWIVLVTSDFWAGSYLVNEEPVDYDASWRDEDFIG